MLPIREYVKHPRILLSSFLKRYFFWLPDKLYLQFLFAIETGKRLNLKNPKTFGEKIQWLKLFDYKPEYPLLVDKYAVKDYVVNIIGKEFVIPTLGVWDNIEDVNYDGLPHKFVLKTTYGGGGEDVIICRDKTLFKREDCYKRFCLSSKNDIYKSLRERPYKNVPRRIIAECYIDNREYDLTDYKFYCFSGVPKFCQVIKDRHTKETIDFFDMEWCHQEFCGLNQKAKPADVEPTRPVHFDEMKEMARKLSQGLIFSRIDLYDTIDGPLFGEITLYPASGLGTFVPNKYNNILGEMIKLPL